VKTMQSRLGVIGMLVGAFVMAAAFAVVLVASHRADAKPVDLSRLVQLAKDPNSHIEEVTIDSETDDATATFTDGRRVRTGIPDEYDLTSVLIAHEIDVKSTHEGLNHYRVAFVATLLVIVGGVIFVANLLLLLLSDFPNRTTR
jgi:hypothetical protein